MSHRGREQAAPRAAPAVRTYTCSFPASSPPPCITQKVGVSARITKPSLPPKLLDDTEARFRGFMGHQAPQRVVRDVQHIRLPAGLLVWLNSTSHTVTAAVALHCNASQAGHSNAAAAAVHSPCQAPPPRLIRVEQTLAQHQSVLHHRLQSRRIPSARLQLRHKTQDKQLIRSPGTVQLSLDPLPTCHKHKAFQLHEYTNTHTHFFFHCKQVEWLLSDSVSIPLTKSLPLKQ